MAYPESVVGNKKRSPKARWRIPKRYRKPRKDMGEQVNVSQSSIRKQEEIPESKLVYLGSCIKSQKRCRKISYGIYRSTKGDQT